MREARAVLVALLLTWGALLLWTMRHGERLLTASADAAAVASTTGVVASGALPSGSPPAADVTPLAGTSAAANVPSGVDGTAANGGENGGAGSDADAEDGEREAADGALAAARMPSVPAIDGRDTFGVAASGAANAGGEVSAAGTAGPAGAPDGPDVSSAEIDVAGSTDAPAPAGRGTAATEPGADVDTDADAGTDAGTDAETDAETDADAGADTALDRGAESVFEVRRREELATLSTLLGGLRFEPLGSAPSSDSRAPLERAFEILFLYPDTRLELVVEGRESNDAAFDRRLGNERADAIVDYLASRGIERGRLSARGGDGAGLPFGEHRVRVTVEDENR